MNCLTSRSLSVIFFCLAGWQAAAARGAVETVVYSFQNNGTDGNSPYAGLIASDGLLYGTTEYGGAGNCGTIFSFDPATGNETVLSALPAGGCRPEAPLIRVGNILYGTTFQGGKDEDGVVFAYNLSNGVQRVLHSFQNSGGDGIWPTAALLHVNGVGLYGTTDIGGTYGGGTVFFIDPTNNAEKVVYSFCRQNYCEDGENPLAALIEVNGVLYGTTETGGASITGGTLFSLDPASGVHEVIYSCGASDNPEDPLINVSGKLYGATWGGGAYAQGQVFKFKQNGKGVETLYSFSNSSYDAHHPAAAPLSANGMLYGTTPVGGSLGCGRGGCGAVYAIDANTGAETVLYAFKDKQTDGQIPYASLVDLGGTLYGTTYYGGSDNEGVIFKLVPDQSEPPVRR